MNQYRVQELIQASLCHHFQLVLKIWRKIGTRKQHTLIRLKAHSILKLEDELEVQETTRPVLDRFHDSSIPPISCFGCPS